MDFNSWLLKRKKKNGRYLSATSAEHYSSAIVTLSREALHLGIIQKNLFDMNIVELDIAINIILNHPYFINKDTVGNKMYSNSLRHFRAFRYETIELNQINESELLQIIDPNDQLKSTVRQTIVNSRVGQGKYREGLITKYGGKCIISGISTNALLIASHIKPWAICNNFERLDVENGFLLSASYDKLFDLGYISFQNNGRILISDFLSNQTCNILNIKADDIYDIKPSPILCHYLDYHRSRIFIK